MVASQPGGARAAPSGGKPVRVVKRPAELTL
jgi:hypothetical protein